MSAFNTLLAEVECSICHQKYEARVQFKFGDTWQHEYHIGEKIKWGGNDIGNPNISKVKAYGVLEINQCPICGKVNGYNEFDIIIENDRIIKINPLSNIKDYSKEDGNYSILKN